jgi:hypothetical protein
MLVAAKNVTNLDFRLRTTISAQKITPRKGLNLAVFAAHIRCLPAVVAECTSITITKLASSGVRFVIGAIEAWGCLMMTQRNSLLLSRIF